MEPADIRRLLDAFEHSDWNEIRLSVDGVEVFISAEESGGGLPASAPPASAAAGASGTSDASVAPPQAETTAAAEAEPAVADVPEGTPVAAPSPGIFWRSPSPGAPPFVEVGQRVEPDSVVCIVEVMKLMNRVSAGVGGTVVAILVDNGGKVASGQPMVVVATDA